MSTPALVAQRLVKVHGWILKAVADRDEEQLRERIAPTAPSIGFHLWHVARWADRVQAALPAMHPDLERLGRSEELWLATALAAAWGFPAAVAADANGMGLDDDVSASLPLPLKAVLLDSAGRSFAAADRAATAAAASEEIFATPCTDLYGRPNPIGDVVIGHLSHAGRHLGMIEALRGLSGRGSATI